MYVCMQIDQIHDHHPLAWQLAKHLALLECIHLLLVHELSPELLSSVSTLHHKRQQLLMDGTCSCHESDTAQDPTAPLSRKATTHLQCHQSYQITFTPKQLLA